MDAGSSSGRFDADEARLERLLASAEGSAREQRRLAEQSEAEGRRLRNELDHRRAVNAKTSSWQAEGGSLLVGDGITDNTMLVIGRFLGPMDLLHLQLTNTRFSTKCIAAPIAAAVPAAAPEMLSLVEEAGRQWLAGCSEQERGWMPRCAGESLLGLMHAVELLRVPLVFGRAHANFTLSEGGAVATTTERTSTYRAAASTVVVRSGRHYAQITVVNGDDMLFGVIRPEWDVEGGEYMYAPDLDDGH